MNLFLDASLVLAACGRPAGASRAVFDMATRNGWTLLTSQYVILEITRNIPRLPVHAASDWAQLRSMLVLVRDVWTMDRPAVFGPAKLFGISLSQLAGWLGRSKQTVSKTPDADSLQNALGYFERVARLRLAMESDAEIRKWLRMPHPDIDGKSPLELMANGQWQALADFVDDILTGTPG